MDTYFLLTWPHSQDCIGDPECILINPASAVGEKEEYPCELDSAYMIPTEEGDNLEDAYVRVEFPEAQRWYGREGTIEDYDTNIFVPYADYVGETA